MSLLLACETLDRFSRNLVSTLCIGRQPNAVILNLLCSVITEWRTHKPIRRERHQRHWLLDPEIMWSKRAQRSMQLTFFTVMYLWNINRKMKEQSLRITWGVYLRPPERISAKFVIFILLSEPMKIIDLASDMLTVLSQISGERQCAWLSSD